MMTKSAIRIGIPLALLAISLTAAGQTLFTTSDYRKDRELWTDPAYYRYNTARQLTDMQVDTRYGDQGSGADEYAIRSPYPYRSSWEHYEAWKAAAEGGTQHTEETLPDWSGVWTGGGSWLNSRGVQASTIAAALTPQYREYYVQQVKAESEGRHWWPASFCLPDGFVRGLQRGRKNFVAKPDQVWIISGSYLVETPVRWIYTDGRGHSPEDLQYPQWHGESIGFWDGDDLVVHTNQIRRWIASHSMFEWSDELTAVERYERVGNQMVAEITLYDPVAFVEPLHATLRFDLIEDPNVRPSYDTCTDTNGPSSNIYVTEDGVINERIPGDPGYWDPRDPRPWASHYAIGE